jgi:nucleoside-diphosphate-sugar epimerase
MLEGRNGTGAIVKVFVTGATGVIGRRVVPALRARGHEITAAARASSRLDALAQPGVTTVVVDLFDATAVRRAVSGHDAVINLATHVPPNTRAFMPGAWKEMDRIRREGSDILSRAAAASGVQRFLQESFAPIYPDNGDRWITEAVLPRPARYNRSVLDAEASAARFADAGGIGVMLRFAFLYGLNDQFTQQLAALVHKGWLPLLGRRDAYFPMITHDDAAAAVVAALNVPGGAYNVVDDRPMTHDAIGQTLATLLNVKLPRVLPAWMAMLGGSLGRTLARSLRVSNAKLRGASGWRPNVPDAAEGLRLAMTASRQRQPSPGATISRSAERQSDRASRHDAPGGKSQ